ncbi:MAG: Na(+)-translocating NADH-quinone reductase subunit C [Thermoanaerobaculia bacterium]|nr:Na(+)-translocating NADH-quinone reductase subunit C [Thermoanaerobaculia bacterium]
MQRSVGYTLLFATLVCVVCAVVVSGAAVLLKERQDENALLDKQSNVLEAAGLREPGVSLPPDVVAERFATVASKVIDLATGEVVEGVDVTSFDQAKLTSDPETSRVAPANPAKVNRIPNQAMIYEVLGANGEVEKYIFPVEGKGLWSTLKGFIALGADLQTVEGLTFYSHKETPGLGGEVDNPGWKARWPGRKVFGPDGEPEIRVIKGRAESPEAAPYQVDGLSGATITSRSVTYLIQFWLGPDAFGPFIEKHRRAA